MPPVLGGFSLCPGFCRIRKGPSHVWWCGGVKGLFELDLGSWLLMVMAWFGVLLSGFGSCHRFVVMHDPTTGFLAAAVCESVCQEVM